MVDIVFPNSTSPGNRPAESSGRLINCFAAKLDDGARNSFSRRRAPGLVTIVNTTAQIGRGAHFYNGILYVAQKDTLSKVYIDGITGNFATSVLGALPGSKRVKFARNNKAPVPDILCLTENDVYVVTDSAPPSSLGDGDLPQPIDITFIDGYFICTIRDGRFFFSALNDKTFSALDFGKAESRPGGLFAGVAYSEQLLLGGPSTIEIWSNAGNATGSPFSRTTVIQKGLASTYAIAGFEEGFSTIVFVGDDNAVYRLDGGYQPTRISNDDLDELISLVADKTQLDINVHVAQGRMWATVTGPNFSWSYDVNSGLWHERKSYLSNRWRAIASIRAFNSDWYALDRQTGSVWRIDGAYALEGTQPLVMVAQSLPMAQFPNRAIFPRADFDIIVGQAKVAGNQPVDTDPVCLIRWSDDGGVSWSEPLRRRLGKTGEYNTPISVNRTGMAGRYGRVWEVSISDPIYAAILGGSVEASRLSR